MLVINDFERNCNVIGYTSTFTLLKTLFFKEFFTADFNIDKTNLTNLPFYKIKYYFYFFYRNRSIKIT